MNDRKDINKTASGEARTVKTMFSRETAVAIQIAADAAIVWALLTNASDYARWNSTIVSLTGTIQVGSEIQLVSTLDKERTFKLKVKAFEPERRLVWGDRMGDRTYTIRENAGAGVVFSMSEKIGGPLFPLFAGQIPPFDQSFEQFAADLKQEAEAVGRSTQ